jgi:hypothetical protein
MRIMVDLLIPKISLIFLNVRMLLSHLVKLAASFSSTLTGRFAHLASTGFGPKRGQ